jgi:hypothetical protein
MNRLKPLATCRSQGRKRVSVQVDGLVSEHITFTCVPVHCQCGTFNSSPHVGCAKYFEADGLTL